MEISEKKLQIDCNGVLSLLRRSIFNW